MFLAAMLLVLPCARAEERAGRDEVFPRPAALEPQVRFWRAIFTDYSERQVVLHDAFDLDKIYAVLDFRPQLADGMSPGEVDRLQRVTTDLELDRLRATLRRLHGARPEDLNAEERRIYDLFRDDPSPDRFLQAAGEKHLRSQRGLRERFGEGLRLSHRYLPEMERIFREEGLPVGLTRLPLIESCFNVNAYSKLGAAGVWQFMPSTGRLFMRVGDAVDERRDPIAATRGAARFLTEMYDDLGAWPLAITGWNHGPDGVARAVRTVGTKDIGRIVHEYQGSSFGFASRNFYAEFLAALDVDEHREAYFGHHVVAPLPRSREFPLDRPVGIEVAARLARTDRDTLAELNPALMDSVVEGRRLIPSGYRLRLPEPGGSGFDGRLAELAAEAHVTRVAAPAPPTRVLNRTRMVAARTHKVANGQTLSHIAKRYKVSVASLRTANRLGRSGTVRAGQVLRIPRST
jgi:membrane-bound lytic murein transglycosylase D